MELPLPRFVGSNGSKQAHAQGLLTVYRLEREGRRLKLGAQPRAFYLSHEHATMAYPLFHVDDTEPVDRQAPA